MMCGAPSDVKPADKDVQDLIEKHIVKAEAEKKSGKSFAEYRAVSYKSQVVAGTNFFVKVNVGDAEFVHMRVFRPLPNVNALPSLVDIQLNKTESDPIEYF